MKSVWGGQFAAKKGGQFERNIQPQDNFPCLMKSKYEHKNYLKRFSQKHF